MKPANSSHLILRNLLSLKERFHRGCVGHDFEVSNMSATVESYAEEDKTFHLDIDVGGNAEIPIDPCFAYQIFVTASVGNENHSESEVISEKFYYNTRVSNGYPYNNELKNEVIDKICLISKDRIRIPETPASLKSCVFTKGDRLFFKEPAINGRPFSGHVEFEITDPHSDFQNPRRICIRTLISQVRNCFKKTSESKRDTMKLRIFNVDMEVCRRKGSIATSQVPRSTVRVGESDYNVTGFLRADNNLIDYNASNYNVTNYVVIGHNVTEYNITDNTVTDHSTTGGILAGLTCITTLLLAGVTLTICKLKKRRRNASVPVMRENIDENHLYGSLRLSDVDEIRLYGGYADFGYYAGQLDDDFGYYAGQLDDGVNNLASSPATEQSPSRQSQEQVDEMFEQYELDDGEGGTWVIDKNPLYEDMM